MFKTHSTIRCDNTPVAYQTFTHQIWWVMVCYDLAHQIRCAKHTFSGRCDITPMVCCSFGGHSTPQFLLCSGGKERKKKTSSPREGFEHTNLYLEGKVPVCIATFALYRDPWLQLLYKYHEGYILNSIAQYPMHMKEKDRESVIELNLKVQKTINSLNAHAVLD